jgi:hypothetical protein
VRPARAAQRREQVEPAWPEALAGDPPGERSVGEARGAEGPTEQRKRGYVRVRALAAPLRGGAVDMVKVAFSRCSW